MTTPVTAFVCPPGCPCECATGGPCEHDWRGSIVLRDSRGRACGAALACSRCGVDAMAHDQMVLP